MPHPLSKATIRGEVKTVARLRNQLLKASADDGISLVEVVVALMVFSIIALGVGYSALTILRITEDTRSREVATNLATTELDIARAMPDPFDVLNATSTKVVGGTTFTIKRVTSWVTTSGADVACGTGTGTLQSKRVNVTVTWNGMLTTTTPVRTDTLISPDTRINDPSLGTIRIAVIDVAGSGSAGVSVNIQPTAGGQALKTQPDVTDADGCSYALKVAPGTYSVTISRTASVDTAQVASPSSSVVVTAGGSVATQFQYDYAAKFNLQYASNYAGAVPKLPTDLTTTYISTYSSYVDTGIKSQVSLHPFTSGYTGIAGTFVAPSQSGNGCINVDPASWGAIEYNGTHLAPGVRAEPTAAAPQAQASMGIPMGVASVTFTTAAYLTAVSATSTVNAGDPGCSVPMTYSFGKILVNGTVSVALPYGSWTLYSSSTQTGSKTVIASSKIAPLTLGYSNNNVLTLDPRAAE